MTNVISSLIAKLGSCGISLAYESLCSISYAIYMFRLVDLSYGGSSLYFRVCPCPRLGDPSGRSPRGDLGSFDIHGRGAEHQ
jgi:hypothetical protein